MKVLQCKFSQLPSILLVKIGRSQKDTTVLNGVQVECPENWDMAGFVVEGYRGVTAYELAATVCFN